MIGNFPSFHMSEKRLFVSKIQPGAVWFPSSSEAACARKNVDLANATIFYQLIFRVKEEILDGIFLSGRRQFLAGRDAVELRQTRLSGARRSTRKSQCFPRSIAACPATGAPGPYPPVELRSRQEVETAWIITSLSPEQADAARLLELARVNTGAFRTERITARTSAAEKNYGS
ncbi:MAG: hypothetical protein ACYDH9_12530 [Limisphaerales bacterium]